MCCRFFTVSFEILDEIAQRKAGPDDVQNRERPALKHHCVDHHHCSAEHIYQIINQIIVFPSVGLIHDEGEEDHAGAEGANESDEVHFVGLMFLRPR